MANVSAFSRMERYSEIVQAAVRAFAQRGYGGTTLGDIATEAGVSQPRISQIFGSKENAFIEAHKSAADEVLGLLRANAAPPYDRRALGQGYAAMLQQRPEVLRLIFQALTSSYVASIGAEARRVIDGVVDIVVNECQGTHADAVEFLERGFFIHAMLAANVFEHADEVPTTGAVLESLNLL